MSTIEVASIVGTCDPSTLVRVLRDVGTSLGGVHVGDHADMAGVITTQLGMRGPRAHHRTHSVLSALVQPAWRAVVAALGERSADPSVADLIQAFELIAEEIPDAACRLVVAVGIEQRVPAEQALREIAELDQRFAVVDAQGSLVIPRRAVPAADARVREQRRQRRRERARERQVRTEQRLSAVRFQGGDLDIRDDDLGSDADASAVASDLISVRGVHPRLRAGADGESHPVGYLGTAYIAWGRAQGEGKRRPVVIIGATPQHLWVRPCYSRDLVAGGWRAVRIVDWASAGLTHEGFVANDVVKLRRSAVTVTRYRFSDRDWNAICRGEVHVD